MRSPYVATLLWPSVGVKPNAWKKWGFGVLRDSRMFRARQQGPKHLALGVFLVSLESSWNVDIENALAFSIWTSVSQVMGKRRAGSQEPGHLGGLPVWLPTTKSRESTSSRCPIWECDTSLKRSWRGLQLRFRPRRDPRSGRGAMTFQSPGSPEPGHLGGFRDSNLGVLGKRATWVWVRRSVVEYTIWGMVVASPKSGPWCVSWSKMPVACPNTQGCPGMWTNHVGGLFWCRFKLDLLNLLPSLIPGLPTRPSTPFLELEAKSVLPNFDSATWLCETFNLVSPRDWGARHLIY